MQHIYQKSERIGPGKHNMLKLGFITNVLRWSTFNDKIGKTPFKLRVRVICSA